MHCFLVYYTEETLINLNTCSVRETICDPKEREKPVKNPRTGYFETVYLLMGNLKTLLQNIPPPQKK